MLSPIPEDWAVPKVFRERMGSSAGRQRAMSADRHLLLILHELPSAHRRAERRARYFWRKPSGSWETSGSGSTTIDPLKAHVTTFLNAIEELESELEAADSASDYFRVLRFAVPLLRSTRNLAKVLQEAREAVDKDRELIAVRDMAIDAERAIELVHQHAGQGLDFRIAASNEEQTRQTEYLGRANHRLNLLAAATLPLSAIGGLLGINLVSGLETWNAPWTFWAVAALSVALGAVLRSTLPSPPPALPTPEPRPRK